ncbi:MAG TPA: hypothetical protein VMC86_08120 [Gemmatimonadales bacterium]|nr:hypothetical protein [Gemmatimonadales bacterium]
MQCVECQSKGRVVTRRFGRRDHSADRLRTLCCASCGRLLPAPDPTERLLGTLAGLSRFGLAAEGHPVLAPRRVRA